jgi:hypothetical protein
MSYESCVIFQCFAENSSATEVCLACIDNDDFISVSCFSAFVCRFLFALEKEACFIANNTEILELNRFKLPFGKHQRYDK